MLQEGDRLTELMMQKEMLESERAEVMGAADEGRVLEIE